MLFCIALPGAFTDFVFDTMAASSSAVIRLRQCFFVQGFIIFPATAPLWQLIKSVQGLLRLISHFQHALRVITIIDAHSPARRGASQ